MDFNVESNRDPISTYRNSEFAEAVAEREEAILTATQFRYTDISIYRSVIRWTLMAATFLMPLFFLPWTTSVLEFNKQLLMLVVGGVLLVSWLLSVVSSGRLSWRTSPFDKGLLAVGAATLVAAVFSVNWSASVFGTANSAAMSLVSVLVFLVFYFVAFNSESDMGERLANILSISLVIALLYGLLQILGIYLFKSLNVPIFNSHAFNSVGTVNALGIIAAVALPLFQRKGLNISIFKYLNMAGTILALAILIILNWWILWTVAIAGLVGLIAFESIATKQSQPNFDISKYRYKISQFLMPMTVIVLGVFLMIVNFSLVAVKNNLPIEVAPSFSLSAQVAKRELKQDLITGSGPSQYSLAFDRYGASQLSGSTLSSAKFFGGTSQLFTSVTEGGLVMILALLTLLWTFVQGVRKFIRNPISIYRNIDIPAFWAMLAASGAAFAFYPFNMSIAFLAVMALTLASLSLWSDRIKDYNIEDNVALSLGSSLGFIGGLILVLAGVYFGVSNYIADVRYAQALSETDINKASEKVVSAINWNGENDIYYRGASQAVLALLNQELTKPADTKDTQRSARINNYVSSAVNLAKQATATAPEESLNWSNLGNVYQSLLGLVDGVDKLAEDSYIQAAKLRPGDASFYNSIGNTYSAKADLYRQLAANNQAQAAVLNQTAAAALVTAEANYKKAIDMSPNYGLAIYNLGNVYARQNKLAEAIRQLEKIAPFNSDQPNLLFQLGLLYYQNNQKDKALTTMQQVLVLSPDFANAHWYLSLIYEERKDTANAIAQLERILAVEVNEDNQTVKDRLTQLRAGQKTTTGTQPL